VIIDTLRTTGYPMTPTQLATVLGANLNTVKVHLLRLVERGLVCKTGQGQYTHRIITPESAETVTPVTCIPVEEEHTTPPPATTQDAGERMTPLMYTLPVTEDMADGDTVTPVTGDDASATTQTPPVSQRPGLPSTNGHTNGHHHGMTPDLLIPCAVCGGITRWNDRGTLRCSRCWPPRS